MNNNRVIGVTGKGGTGKTLLVTLMAKILARKHNRKLLAIDADSAISLPHALGIKVEKTISDIREQLINDPEARDRIAAKHISETIRSILKEDDGINLLVMGRPEGPGCFCRVNDLLKYGIETISKNFQVTIVDCEAGPEQINRRVLQNVDTLVIVTDTSSRSFRTANSIYEIAKAGAVAEHCNIGLVINRIGPDNTAALRSVEQFTGNAIKIFGSIPEDKNITEFESMDKPVIGLPYSSLSVMAAQCILEEMGINFAKI
ncbi:MAG: AAA family ATPase [Dehalococcoidia bacterium]|jgi:CO dehydrogenase maturation factor